MLERHSAARRPPRTARRMAIPLRWTASPYLNYPAGLMGAITIGVVVAAASRRRRQNPKSESRNPKQARNPKFEHACLGFWKFGFGIVSDFEIRISDFATAAVW